MRLLKNLAHFLAVSVIVITSSCSKHKQNYLFVMHAQSVHLTQDPADPKKGKITLTGLDPDVVFFSDRPGRHAGKLQSTTFLHIWAKGKHSFQKVPPNAALVFSYSDEKSAFKDIPVKIFDPVFRNGELTFSISDLDTGNLKAYNGNGVFLFIDHYKNIPSGCDWSPTKNAWSCSPT